MNTLHRLDITFEEDALDRMTALLYTHISFGWEEESLVTGETRYRIYCDNLPLLEQVSAEAQAIAQACAIERTVVPQEDWTLAWREYFTPVMAGAFCVLPPWRAHDDAEGRSRIIIEPKSAFGTGHHNTTVLCLLALSELKAQGRLTPDKTFFDVGTGSGILAIACSQSGLHGLLADIDPVAIDNARENVVINHVDALCTVRTGSTEQAQGERFDIVIANILAGPLQSMAQDLCACLKPSGTLILSGLLDIQAVGVEAAYAHLGSARKITSGDWVALIWENAA